MECIKVDGVPFTTCEYALKKVSVLGSALRCVQIAAVEFPDSACPLREYSDFVADQFVREEAAAQLVNDTWNAELAAQEALNEQKLHGA